MSLRLLSFTIPQIFRGMLAKAPSATSSSPCPCLKAVSLSQFQPTLPSPGQLESLRMVTQPPSPPLSNPSVLLPNCSFSSQAWSYLFPAHKASGSSLSAWRKTNHSGIDSIHTLPGTCLFSPDSALPASLWDWAAQPAWSPHHPHSYTHTQALLSLHPAAHTLTHLLNKYMFRTH